MNSSPPPWGRIVSCGPCCFKTNKASLLLNTVEPSVPQVPLWHGFIGRICLFKRTLVCPGELLQAGSTTYCLPRRQGPIRDGLRPLPPTPKRNLGLQLRSTLLDPRLVELSEEPRWVESCASRVENGTRSRFLRFRKTLLAALRRTLVEPWPSQSVGKRRGVCGLQRIAHPPAGTPVAQLTDLLPSPPPPNRGHRSS